MPSQRGVTTTQPAGVPKEKVVLGGPQRVVEQKKKAATSARRARKERARREAKAGQGERMDLG